MPVPITTPLDRESRAKRARARLGSEKARRKARDREARRRQVLKSQDAARANGAAATRRSA